MARPDRIRIGDLLVQEQLITEAQLVQALTDQKRTGRKLGRVCIEAGWVTEVQVAKAVARQLRAQFVDLSQHSVRTEVARLLPEVQARRLRALPIEDTPAALRVALADPTDIAAFDEVARLTRREIELVVVAESQLLATLDRAYRHGDEIAGLARELTSELALAESDIGDILGLTSATTEDAPVVRLLSTVFEEALRLRASDVHIEPQERVLRIRFRIDGVLHVQTEADGKVASAVALRLKLMSGLDISEKRLPQDGRFNVKLRNGAVDVRISTMPTQYGESVVLRLLNPNSGLLGLDRLQLPDFVRRAIERAIARPSGMLLVTGPTGSGKTTTLYAALAALNSTDRKIITVEDPVEYRMPGLNQVQVQDKIDLDFGRVLRAALRQDPDVILVGEMRDRQTAEIGLRAAMTGHLVLSTLHTNDAISTPVRLVDMGVPAYMVALSLHLVLAQRLVRLVCPHCAEPYRPTDQEAQWLRQHAGDAVLDAPLRAGRGCPECNDSGYSGRAGVYEVLEMTQGLVDALAHPQGNRFAGLARTALGGRTLAHDALRLVLDGRTTLQEAMRVGAQLDD